MTSLSNAFGFLKTKATEVAAKVGDQVTTINEQVTPHLLLLVLPTPALCSAPKHRAVGGEVMRAVWY